MAEFVDLPVNHDGTLPIVSARFIGQFRQSDFSFRAQSPFMSFKNKTLSRLDSSIFAWE